MPSNHLILCHPLVLLSIFPSIRVFSNDSVLCIRWPKYWSFSLSISPSNEYSGLISFRMDWLDLLAAQGTLKSFLQHHSSKASILWRSAFLLIFLPAILIPACASYSPAFLMMYSAYKLNKQGDNIQPWHTPFSIWNQSVVLCPVLSVASWPAYRFLRRQVRWSGIPTSWRIFQFVLIHTVKSFGIVNKAEVDVFQELSCFFDDPMDVGNLISGSSAFSKSSLNIWNFTVHILLKPGLENFEHYFASVWDECNCAVVWTFLGIAHFWDWNENWPFPVLWPLLGFPNFLAFWVQHFNGIIF